jgi:hypothetical protein
VLGMVGVFVWAFSGGRGHSQRGAGVDFLLLMLLVAVPIGLLWVLVLRVRRLVRLIRRIFS